MKLRLAACCSPPPRSDRRPARAIDPAPPQVLPGTVRAGRPAPGPCRPPAGADPASRCRRPTRTGSPGASSTSPRWRPGWARRRSGSTAASPAARRILVFRRVGRKIVAEIENQPLPRHRRRRPPSRRGCATASLIRRSGWATSPPRRRTAGCSSTSPPSSPATRWASPRRCKDGGGGEFRLVPELSVADPNSVRVFPRQYRAGGAADLHLRRADRRGQQYRAGQRQSELRRPPLR